MKRIHQLSSAALIAALALTANSAFAGDGQFAKGLRDKSAHARVERAVDRRMDRQERRINHGARNGELTRGEARHLRKDHRRIERADRRFESDGHYSHKERGLIRKALDKSGHKIHKAKHNHRDRSHRYDRSPKHYRKHGYGHKHGHGRKYGHGHKRGHKYGHRHGHGHKYGHRHGHGHKHGHRHHGHKHYRKYSHSSIDFWLDGVRISLFDSDHRGRHH